MEEEERKKNNGLMVHTGNLSMEDFMTNDF